MLLLDVNILLYAVDESSPRHARARAFLDAVMQDDEVVALPWAVVLGFLRISTNARIFETPLSVNDAVAMLDAWFRRPHVTTLDPGPEHWSILSGLLAEHGGAANRVPDAHLAALAIERGAELCSADADFGRYGRLKWRDPVRG